MVRIYPVLGQISVIVLRYRTLQSLVMDLACTGNINSFRDVTLLYPTSLLHTLCFQKTTNTNKYRLVRLNPINLTHTTSQTLNV